MTPETFERITGGRSVVDVIAQIAGLSGQLTMTPEETAQRLNWGRTKTYEALRAGQLPSRKVAGRYVISVPALLLWLLDVDEATSDRLKAVR